MKKAALFIPCSVNLLLPEIAVSVERIIEKAGVHTVYPDSQTCCGQIVYNSGFFDEARKFARHFISVFENHEAVVCPSGSCCAMVKHNYPLLFRDDHYMKRRAEDLSGRIFEFTQYLVDVLGINDTGAVFEGKVAYHESCHLLRELGVSAQPKALINATKGAKLVHMKDAEMCCGFGGEFSLDYPEISTAMVEDKVKNFIESGADVLVTGEPGCLLNIRGYLDRNHPDKKALHIAEFLNNRGGQDGY